MHNPWILLTGALALVFACSEPMRAQADLRQSDDSVEEVAKLDFSAFTCAKYQQLIDLDDGRSEVVTVWAQGYYSGRKGVDETSPAVTWETVAAFAARLVDTCRQAPEELWLTAIKQLD